MEWDLSVKPLITRRREHSLVLMINRPEVHHAIDDETMGALELQLDVIEQDETIRSVVLTASGGRTFCAGGDLRYFATLKTAAACREMSQRMQAILSRFHRGRVPVIAAVNGKVFGGGCELLTACHLRIAAAHATFSFRQAPNGILTGWGGGARLFRQVPAARALQLVLTGEHIDGEQALAMGLVSDVVPEGTALTAALDVAAKINEHPPAAIAAFIELYHLSMPPPGDRENDGETEGFVTLWMGDHFQQILRQFARE